MAIGKADAYATVEPSKVDFGDIALNAQKIQSTSLDRFKDMIPKQKERKPYTLDKLGYEQYSDNNYFNVSVADGLMNDVLPEYTYLSLKRQDGDITPEEMARLNNTSSIIKKTGDSMKLMLQHSSEYAKNLPTFSPAFKSKMDMHDALYSADGQNSEWVYDKNTGDAYFRAFKTKEGSNGKELELDSNGNKIYQTYIDEYGNETDKVTLSDVQSGRFFNIPKAVDFNKEVNNIASYIGLDTTQSDNGVTKIIKEKMTKEKESALDAHIYAFMNSSPFNKADMAYKIDPKRFPNPKKQYTKEEDQYIFNGIKTMALGGIAESQKTDVTLPSGDGDKDKTKIGLTSLSIDDFILKDEFLRGGKVVNFKGKKEDYYSRAVGLGSGILTSTQGLGNVMAEGLILNKNGELEVTGKRITASNLRFKRDNGESKSASEWDQSDFSSTEKERYDKFIMDSFNQKANYKNFVRKPSAGLQSVILAKTKFKSWEELTAYVKSMNQGNIR